MAWLTSVFSAIRARCPKQVRLNDGWWYLLYATYTTSAVLSVHIFFEVKCGKTHTEPKPWHVAVHHWQLYPQPRHCNQRLTLPTQTFSDTHTDHALRGNDSSLIQLGPWSWVWGMGVPRGARGQSPGRSQSTFTSRTHDRWVASPALINTHARTHTHTHSGFYWSKR